MGFFDKITDENGDIEHLIDGQPLFDEDDDYVDELEILDILLGGD